VAKGSKRIKELRSWAKEYLSDKSVYLPELGGNVHFTNTGIKEYLNQPHKHYYEKNELIKNIELLISEARYDSDAPDMKGNTNSHYYYFKTKVAGDDSYFVIKYTKHNNQYSLYSMVDEIKNR
jgi:hypothetical protein